MTVSEQQFSIVALQNGDRAEFARLVEAFSGPLYRLALKMLGAPQDAEDVLQNTFLKALQSLKSFEGRSSLSTWLYRIAVNEALMLIRKQKPEVPLADTATEDEDGRPDTPLDFTDWCCLPEREFVTAESRQALDDAIRRLPETLRVVFLLRDIEGLSIRETCETLGLTETAVKTRLLRARLRLRELLASYYGERIAERKD